MKIVVIGLSVTSSWGNGHATTYRGLLKELHKLGHDILFLEKDVPYYAENRDMPDPDFCVLGLYGTEEELKMEYQQQIAHADLVVVGSYVQHGVDVGDWVQHTAQGITAFYDIDTPVTLAKLKRKDYEYLHPRQIAKYDLYLSFTGGPILKHLEEHYGAPMAKALYCSVDPDMYYPEQREVKWKMGYLGTYSDDRQPTLEAFLLEQAKLLPEKNFVVAGPQYPKQIDWPENVDRIHHLPPSAHRAFYNEQEFTLNVTRRDMIAAGYAPSVRLFEAAASGVPIISDFWEGLSSLFEPEKEIIIAKSQEQVYKALNELSQEQRQRIADGARAKVLSAHTSKARALQLLKYVEQIHQSTVKPKI